MFRELLQEMVDGTDGGMAGLLMGFDGIAVDQYIREEGSLDVETVGMEYSVILKQIRQAAEMLDAGSAREVAILAEKVTTVIRMLNDEYFVALAIGPQGNFGKGRYLLRMNSAKLLTELE